jgi:hypothetical protein
MIPPQSGKQAVAGRFHAGQDVFTLDDFEHGLAHRGRNGISAKSIEIATLFSPGGGNLGRGDNNGQWVSITHRLPHGHDIRNDAGILESPVMIAQPRQARLYLVRHDQAAGGTDFRVYRLQIGRRWRQYRPGVVYRVDDHHGRRPAVLSQRVDRIIHQAGVRGGDIRVVRPERSTVHVRRFDIDDEVRCLMSAYRVARKFGYQR